MFLLDDILLSPVKAIMAIGRQVQDKARNDLKDQEKDILNSLAELHQMIESKSIGDEQFNERESTLLDRLDSIQNMLNSDDENDDDGV
jgi:hypothetical protein